MVLNDWFCGCRHKDIKQTLTEQTPNTTTNVCGFNTKSLNLHRFIYKMVPPLLLIPEITTVVISMLILLGTSSSAGLVGVDSTGDDWVAPGDV